VYWDPGGRHRIVAFIRSGGLERARTRQIDGLRERGAQPREAVAWLARDRGGSDPHAALAGGWDAWTSMIGGGSGDCGGDGGA
jgi:hypothetical protein